MAGSRDRHPEEILTTGDAVQPHTDNELWLPLKGNKPGDPVSNEVVFRPAQNPALDEQSSYPVYVYELRGNAVILQLRQLLGRVRDEVVYEFATERDRGSFTHVAPVFMAMGIASYFAAVNEPYGWVLLATFGVLLFGVARMASRGVVWFVLAAAMFFFAGMGAAKIQVMRAYMPVPIGEITAKVEGLVLETDMNRRGAPRYVLKPFSIGELPAQFLPKKVRFSSSGKHEAFLPGTTISGLARMGPVSGPAYPGGYDFSFHAWFKGQGMSGFFMGKPEIYASSVKAGLIEQAGISINRWRAGIAQRIRKGLAGEPGDIAVALITGDRSGLSKETQESLRRSGLAHILAISGLHMALVTLTVIWVSRGLFAVIPGFVTRYPAKKFAAATGFGVATAYLMVSGNSIATQRAWIMISIMLMASLMDRRAITMRSVAMAALVILALFPASLFEPGFQMSFAAVAALVAFYTFWTRRRWQRQMQHETVSQGFLVRLAGYFAGLGATSIVAGFATALFALWHFHRLAPLGVIANLGAMPVVSVFVMPLSLLTMILMPYGFEELALKPLGHAIETVLLVSDSTNQYTVDYTTGAQPTLLLVLAVAFLCALCLPQGRLKYLAVIPFVAFALFVFLGNRQRVPDLLIAQGGRAIAVSVAAQMQDSLEPGTLAKTQTLNAKEPENPNSNENGAQQAGLALVYPRRNKFVSSIWLRAYSNNKAGKFRSIDGEPCGKDQCQFMLKGRKVFVVYDPALLQQACADADILAAPRLWWVKCRGRKPHLVLTRRDFEAMGTHAIFLDTQKRKPADGRGGRAEKQGLEASADPNSAKSGLQGPVAEPSQANSFSYRIETAWPPLTISVEPYARGYRKRTDHAEDERQVIQLFHGRRPWLHRYEPPAGRKRPIGKSG